MKVLVTSVGGDIAQSMLKCLRDSKHDPILIGCDCNPYAGGRGAVDLFTVSPPVTREAEYILFLRDLIRREGIRYVFPVSYPEIQFFHSHKEEFTELGAVFIAQEAGVFETFVDKYATIEFLAGKNLPFPRTWLAEDYRNQMDFPLIMKKRRGSGSRECFIVRNREELRFWLTRTEDMIIQEYLPGKDNEYTSGLFNSRADKITITFRRTLAPGGFSQQVELTEDKEVTEFTQAVAEALNFSGSLNLQFRLTERGCVPFEINPRFSSSVYFRHLFGFKDVEWSLDMEEGRPVVYEGPVRRGVGVRTMGEIILDEGDGDTGV